MSRVRIEVDRFGPSGPRTTVLFLDTGVLDGLSVRQRELVDQVYAELLAAADAAGPEVRTAVFCELVEQLADGEAYEREARRRGVLPL